MNRILTSIAALLMCVGAWADNDAVLSKIEKNNETVHSLQCSFTQTKTLKASGKVIKSEGELFFTSDRQLSMVYSQPQGELLVINGAKMYMCRGDKKNVFNTDKNRQMNSLSNTLINCIEGKIQTVATEVAANVDVNEEGGNFVVTLSATAAAARGYSRIVLNYRKSDCTLTKMVMTEFSGIENVYEMASIKKGVSIDTGKFSIPEK